MQKPRAKDGTGAKPGFGLQGGNQARYGPGARGRGVRRFPGVCGLPARVAFLAANAQA
jgi:hypothetical protein